MPKNISLKSRWEVGLVLYHCGHSLMLGHFIPILGTKTFKGDLMREEASLTYQRKRIQVILSQWLHHPYLQKCIPSTCVQWRATLGHRWASWQMEERLLPHWSHNSCGRMRGHQSKFKMKAICFLCFTVILYGLISALHTLTVLVVSSSSQVMTLN